MLLTKSYNEYYTVNILYIFTNYIHTFATLNSYEYINMYHQQMHYSLISNHVRSHPFERLTFLHFTNHLHPLINNDRRAQVTITRTCERRRIATLQKQPKLLIRGVPKKTRKWSRGEEGAETGNTVSVAASPGTRRHPHIPSGSSPFPPRRLPLPSQKGLMVAPDHSRPPNADNTPEISTKRSQPRVDFRGEYSGLPLSSFHLPALSALAIFVIVVGRWPPCVESSFDSATELFSTVHWLAKPMARGIPKGCVYCSGIFGRLLGVRKRREFVVEWSEWTNYFGYLHLQKIESVVFV